MCHYCVVACLLLLSRWTTSTTDPTFCKGGDFYGGQFREVTSNLPGPIDYLYTCTTGVLPEPEAPRPEPDPGPHHNLLTVSERGPRAGPGQDFRVRQNPYTVPYCTDRDLADVALPSYTVKMASPMQKPFIARHFSLMDRVFSNTVPTQPAALGGRRIRCRKKDLRIFTNTLRHISTDNFVLQGEVVSALRYHLTGCVRGEISLSVTIS